jgi:uncharacterized membrane protein
LQNLSSKSCLLLSGLGIGISIYHAYNELTENFQSCNISSKVSCGGVFESGYTSVFGIPFWALGNAWFILVFVVCLTTTNLGRYALNGAILLPLLMVGNIFTVYLWYLEIGVIGVICPVCVSLYVINYILTVVTMLSLT